MSITSLRTMWATRLHILQYIAMCFLDEAIIGQTHMMIMDYALCVCVSMSFAERNFWQENHAGHSAGISMLLFTWSIVRCARFDR